MPDPLTSNPETPEKTESTESFGDILSQYQKSHSHKPKAASNSKAPLLP